MVLLQEIATLTGGVYHAVHSPADIGKLHEIYIHLQALTGGEEVITSGSDDVAGISRPVIGDTSATLAGAGGLAAELFNIVDLSHHNVDAETLSALRQINEHSVIVDDTMESVTMMVSSHDPGWPVIMNLLTPSGKVLKPGTVQALNHVGSSYQYFRVEDPEPGEWRIRVRAKLKDNDNIISAAYTYGAYGRTPLRLVYKLPEKLFGAREIKLAVGLEREEKFARSVRMTAQLRHPTKSLKDLVKAYRGQLADINLEFKPDSPKADPNLLRLAMLDKRMSDAGKDSLFRSRLRNLRLSRANGFKGSFKPEVPGIHQSRITASGATREGLKYQRTRIFDIVT